MNAPAPTVLVEATTPRIVLPDTEASRALVSEITDVAPRAQDDAA